MTIVGTATAVVDARLPIRKKLQEAGKDLGTFASRAKRAGVSFARDMGGGIEQGASRSLSAIQRFARSGSRQLKKFGDSFRGELSKIGNAAKDFGGKIAALGIAGAGLFAIAEGANKFNVAKQAFDAAGGSLAELRKETQGLLSDFDLVTKSNLARTFGITGDAFTTLTKIAQASAATTGQSFDFLFESAITGTARLSKPILDNLGILVSVKSANEEYAKSLGKTASQLTDAEKSQAFFNAVTKKGSTILKELEEAGIDLASPFAGFTAQLKNAGTALGQLLLPAAQALIAATMPLLDGIRQLGELFRQLTPTVQKFVSFIPAVALLGPILLGVAFAGKTLLTAFLSPAGLILGGLIIGVAALATAWSENFFDIQGATKSAVKFIRDSFNSLLFFLGFIAAELYNGTALLVATFAGVVVDIITAPFLAVEALERFIFKSLANVIDKSVSTVKRAIQKIAELAREFPSVAKFLGIDPDEVDAFADRAEKRLKGLSAGLAAKSKTTDAASELRANLKSLFEVELKDPEKVGEAFKKFPGELADAVVGLVTRDEAEAKAKSAAAAIVPADTSEAAESVAKLGKAADVSADQVEELDLAGLLSGRVREALSTAGLSTELAPALSESLASLIENQRLDGKTLAMSLGKFIGGTGPGASLLETIFGAGMGTAEAGGVAGGAVFSVASAAVSAFGQAVETAKGLIMGLNDAVGSLASSIADFTGDARLQDLAGKLTPFITGVILAGAAITTLAQVVAGVSTLGPAATIGAFGAALGPLIAPIAFLAANLLALGAAVLFLAGAISAGIGVFIAFAVLATQTETMQRVMAAFQHSMDRLVKAAEPLAFGFFALAGLFDAFVDVIIPLFDAFGSVNVAARAMFEIFKIGALAIGSAIFVFALLSDALIGAVQVLAQWGEGIAGSGNFLIEIMDTVANGMIGFMVKMLQGLQSFLSGLGALTNTLQTSIAESIAGLGGIITGGGAAEAIETSLGFIANTAESMRPDVDAVGQALEDISDLTYEEALIRGQQNSQLEEMNDELQAGLLNVPEIVKVAALRFNSASVEGGSAAAGAGAFAGVTGAAPSSPVSIFIENLQTDADNIDDLRRAIMDRAEEVSEQLNGSPFSGSPFNRGSR